MTLALEVLPDAQSAARRAAQLIVQRLREKPVPGTARARHPRLSVAFSGGTTPGAMLQALGEHDLPWHEVSIFQVDERVAPRGHDDRNLTMLLSALPAEARASVHAMPVEEPDLEAAARRYAELLPEQLDLVHLGLGPDGHTASLVPGDPVLDARDRRVAVTGEYQSFRRMTLTYPALEAAREIVWLVTGGEKADALARLLARDTSIPAARIENHAQSVVADEAAGPPPCVVEECERLV